MLVRCADCGNEFVVDLVTVERKPGVFEVGFECPLCHTWHHSYFSNQSLEQRRAMLAKFRAKAGKSAGDWERYRRKKQQFATAFDRLNPAETPAA